jgi:hypothetical protein
VAGLAGTDSWYDPTHAPTHLCVCAAADTVRVKSMNARLEEDVSVSELPTYLLTALNPHGGAATAASARMHTQGSRPPGDDGEGLGEPEEAHAHGWRQRRRR